MEIQTKTGNYQWLENWITIPESQLAKENGRTHGVVALKNGNIAVNNQALPSVLIYNPDGELVNSFGDFPGAHGMTSCQSNGEEYLWLTDEFASRVVKLSLSGDIVMELPRPQHEIYSNGGKYVPTWAAQDPLAGNVWVADGYGSSLVHCFSPQAELMFTIDGTEGIGRFDCPHGLNFTINQSSSELFITDRSSKRIVVYDGSGKFLRSCSDVHSPCNFEFAADRVIVAELYTGIKIFNKNTFELIDEIGVDPKIAPSANGMFDPPKGWPDLAGTEYVRPGFFNSPHSACMADSGDIYVVEWIITGRVTKLKKI